MSVSLLETLGKYTFLHLFLTSWCCLHSMVQWPRNSLNLQSLFSIAFQVNRLTSILLLLLPLLLLLLFHLSLSLLLTSIIISFPASYSLTSLSPL